MRRAPLPKRPARESRVAPLAPPRVEARPAGSIALALFGALMTTVAVALTLARGGLGPNAYLLYATIALGIAAWHLRETGSVRNAALAG
jgi:hypothetical protein